MARLAPRPHPVSQLAQPDSTTKIDAMAAARTVSRQRIQFRLMVDAVATRDLPLIQTCAMIFCLSYLALITAADIVAILSNPRLRK